MLQEQFYWVFWFTAQLSLVVNARVPSAYQMLFQQLTLNDDPEGNSEFFFPEILNVSREEVEGNIEIRGKQNLLFPKGPVIKWFVI